MKFPIPVPMIGPWLYRRSAKELATRVLHGDAAAVRNLADMLCTSRDEAVRDIAYTALCSLTSVSVIDMLCRETLARDDAALRSIAARSNYLPSDPKIQALFLFVTGQREPYVKRNPQAHHPQLASGYAQTTNQVRFQTRSLAKKSGQCPVLAAALMGTEPHGNPALWSEEEWEIIVTGLVQEHQWKVLWRLVVHAPLHLAVTAMSVMNAEGWKPSGDDRALWEEIIQSLPVEWTRPVPQDALSSPAWSPDTQPLRLAFSGDGILLAAGCADGTVCLWNTRTGTLVFRFSGEEGTISGLTFSSDNTRLLCAGTGGTLQCRDTETGTRTWSVATGEQALTQISCSRNGSVIVPRSNGGHLLIVNLTDGEVQDISGGYDTTVTCCTLSHEDRFCAVGYADGAVGFWDLQKRQYMQTLGTQGDPVCSLTFCEGDEEILVVYEKNRPVRWHITSGERTRTYTGSDSLLRCCAITPDASSFAIAGDERILRFWLAGTTAPIAEIPLYNRPLTACAVSDDGRSCVAGCSEGTLRIYSMNEGTVLHEKKAHKQAVTAIVVSSSADIFASAGGDGVVELWNITSGELLRTLLRPAGGVTGLTVTPDGSSIYAGYADGTVRQIPTGMGACNRTLDMYTSTVRAIAISPDGALLACAGGDTTLRIWNIETGGLVTGIEGLTTTQRCLAFSPDGKTLISGGWDGKVRLWNLPDGSLQKTLMGHTSTITALIITPDGTMLATGSNDQTVRLWTLADGLCISVRENSLSEVSALALSPDGSLLAFGGADAVIHLCHLPDGIPAPAIPALPGTITALAFAGKGRVLVTALDTGTVAVYSCAGRHLLRTVPAHSGAVTGIVVLPGGESVLTSGLDGQVCRWNLPWTRPMSGTTLDDIPLVTRYERTSIRADARTQWAFLHHMLAVRFTNDIELCARVNDESIYDIQIVG